MSRENISPKEKTLSETEKVRKLTHKIAQRIKSMMIVEQGKEILSEEFIFKTMNQLKELDLFKNFT